MIELYFGPGACSFVPHVALEAIKAQTGEAFEPRLVKLHKGEQKAPEYLALNPNGQVPVLVAEGKALTQIVAICDYLDRRYPALGFLPADSWARAQALSQLAWMNNTVHPTFTHVFRASDFAESAAPFWFGTRLSFHDAYAFTLLRWGGYVGIDPDSLPAYRAYVERVIATPPVAAALERERVKLDTFKAAA